jgi:hypothetical protein
LKGGVDSVSRKETGDEVVFCLDSIAFRFRENIPTRFLKPCRRGVKPCRGVGLNKKYVEVRIFFYLLKIYLYTAIN